MAENYDFVRCNLIGQMVKVEKMDGQWYEGIYHDHLDGVGVVLKMATKLNERVPVKELKVGGEEIKQILAESMEFIVENVGVVEGFQTDTEISLRAGVYEHELVPWQQAEGDPMVDMSLDEEMKGKKRLDWDQFAENKKRFGVESTWDESMYTTQLDRKSETYLKYKDRAKEIANEIMKEGTTNPHMLEERGIETNRTEEEKYSSVLTAEEAGGNTGAYEIPARRTEGDGYKSPKNGRRGKGKRGGQGNERRDSPRDQRRGSGRKREERRGKDQERKGGDDRRGKRSGEGKKGGEAKKEVEVKGGAEKKKETGGSKLNVNAKAFVPKAYQQPAQPAYPVGYNGVPMHQYPPQMVPWGYRWAGPPMGPGSPGANPGGPPPQS